MAAVRTLGIKKYVDRVGAHQRAHGKALALCRNGSDRNFPLGRYGSSARVLR